LGVHPAASMREIRQAYRELSKLYHPDTTTLPTAIATAKFQQLNEAYATLSNTERRGVYDRKIGYSSVAVVQPLPSLHLGTKTQKYQSSSAYLDPTDRPLSPGELFALFILGLTFIGCLCLAIMVGLTRGESLLTPKMVENETVPPLVQPNSAPVRFPGSSANQGGLPKVPIPSTQQPAEPLSRSPSLPPATNSAADAPPALPNPSQAS
jgi:curved DNA-binding protein CbpA